MTTLHDLGGVLGRPWDTFLLGSHSFMVTAHGPMCEVALGHSGREREELQWVGDNNK